ncbi:MAG: NADH-quinone oxidoreductase subunit NuoE [Puniceicoccaceae bacterium]|nr:MAG: NADH-quinone oxidoreductase subunit NuoE [Puniceicoccaceae bacterium]
MLSPAEQAALDAELPHYPARRALCIEALKIVQHHRGWISDEALRDVALALGMTPHEVDSVATFYNLLYRRPVGRHVLHLCDSVSCWVMGCDGICDHFRNRLGISFGETTPDGRFTLLPIPCLGDCDHAPSLMAGNRIHGNLTPEKLDRLLDELD